METEKIFRPVTIDGFVTRYKVSNIGNVWSLWKNDFLKLSINNGYKVVGLGYNKISNMHKVHRLVAQAFIENPKSLEEVNHKDGNKLNNCVSNLEWVTSAENSQHSVSVLNNCCSTKPVQ